jgi:RimJ/RimL family protein N-acetyltransferase
MQLRPPTPADEPFLAHIRRPEVAGEINAFDDPGGEHVKADVSRRIIVLDGTPIGSMSWHGVAYGPNRRSRALNIGITIVPEHQGRGHGTAAQRMLAEHLFATTEANRVEATTDVHNIAEQRALERAGFSCPATCRRSRRPTEAPASAQ